MKVNLVNVVWRSRNSRRYDKLLLGPSESGNFHRVWEQLSFESSTEIHPARYAEKEGQRERERERERERKRGKKERKGIGATNLETKRRFAKQKGEGTSRGRVNRPPSRRMDFPRSRRNFLLHYAECTRACTAPRRKRRGKSDPRGRGDTSRTCARPPLSFKLFPTIGVNNTGKVPRPAKS